MSRRHWVTPPVTVSVALTEPAHRNQVASNQVIEGGQQPLLPGVGQQGAALTGQVGQPVSQAGAGKLGTGPPPGAHAVGEMGPDLLDGGANPGEMRVGSKCDDATALGTAAALQVEAGGKPLEIARDEAMAPDTIMAAAGTGRRQFPRIILAQLKKILEFDGNRIYHRNTMERGYHPQEYGAESSAKTLRPLCFRDKKRPLEEAQIIRQPLPSCQSILKISHPIRFTYCGSLHVVRLQVGIRPVNEPFELGRDVAVVDRRGEHNHVGFCYRVEHLRQVIVQDAVIQALLTGTTPLATPLDEAVQLEGADLGTEIGCCILKTTGDGGAVTLWSGTPQETDDFHSVLLVCYRVGRSSALTQ